MNNANRPLPVGARFEMNGETYVAMPQTEGVTADHRMCVGCAFAEPGDQRCAASPNCNEVIFMTEFNAVTYKLTGVLP